MSLRLIEVFLPADENEQVRALLSDYSFLGVWHEHLENGQLLVKILLYSKEVEPVIELLDSKFSTAEGFRILLLTVEASIPRPELLKPTVSEPKLAPSQTANILPRINREELYVDITQSVKLTWTQNIMVFLSTLIAAIGLIRSSEAVIIGAMVIAPLLKPNMALAVATTLGDLALGLRTVKVGVVGIGISLGLSVLIGLCFPVSPDLPEIIFRTRVGLSDVVLALASGMAGAISLTSGETSAIVGVMVAVALLPPLTALGLLLGSGQWFYAGGAMLLVFTNLICLNLAAVVTLLVQDVRPGVLLEEYRARKATKLALGLWILLLLALIGLILIREQA
ncbi:MAG: TIGR00341 family protein [Cyanophyceae cyanobacterium]